MDGVLHATHLLSDLYYKRENGLFLTVLSNKVQASVTVSARDVHLADDRDTRSE